MKNEIKFKEYMTLLCELHDKILSDMMKDLYWKVLAPFTDEECERAFKELIYENRFFPKPADFMELLQGKKQDQATMAWLEVLGAIKSIGNYKSVKFSNPAIHSVINAMGGWPELCMMESKDEKWKQKEFERLFEVIALRGGNHPAYLLGSHENSNTPVMIERYEERTGKKYNQEVIQVGCDEQKQIAEG